MNVADKSGSIELLEANVEDRQLKQVYKTLRGIFVDMNSARSSLDMVRKTKGGYGVPTF